MRTTATKGMTTARPNAGTSSSRVHPPPLCRLIASSVGHMPEDCGLQQENIEGLSSNTSSASVCTQSCLPGCR